jgi:hypothetical protein
MKKILTPLIILLNFLLSNAEASIPQHDLTIELGSSNVSSFTIIDSVAQNSLGIKEGYSGSVVSNGNTQLISSSIGTSNFSLAFNFTFTVPDSYAGDTSLVVNLATGILNTKITSLDLYQNNSLVAMGKVNQSLPYTSVYSLNQLTPMIISGQRYDWPYNLTPHDNYTLVLKGLNDPVYGVAIIQGTIATVPIPSAIYLFATSIIGLMSFTRRK